MKICLFSYWGIDDGISQGTLLPLLEVIRRQSRVQEIYLCTVETSAFTGKRILGDKAVHVPIVAKGTGSVTKFVNLIRIPLLVLRKIRETGIDLMWCKGAPAGGVGYIVHLLGGTIFVVDSFEPHSRYMVDSGTWSRTSLKYLIQSAFEMLIKRHAQVLLPVSYHYAQVLLKGGRPEGSLFVFPCVVNVYRFVFRDSLRKAIRGELRIKDRDIVGVYVGKFGGLYYDNEAFRLYATLFEFFGPDFFLFIISETDRSHIFSRLSDNNIPLERVFVSKVAHASVPGYLSAADFGISTIKSVPAMQFCSPIKHGEYWACGLPVLTTLGTGDDAEIIQNEGGGVIFDVGTKDPAPTLDLLKARIKARPNEGFSRLAYKHRHPGVMEKAVSFVLDKMVTIKKLAD